MATEVIVGTEVKEIDLLNLFPASEGMISQYYGRLGSGKTYAATSDVIQLLRRGEVVYTNWRINYDGFDEMKSWPYIVASIFLPWRKRFFRFPKDNLYYLPVDEEFHEKLAKITDAHIFLDEGHTAFDSYEMARMSLGRRMSILHTRHFDRSIHIVSQRPTAVHVVMRANVNVFYKCERLRNVLWFRRFRRTEYQDLLNETVDEDEEKAISVKYYWGKNKIFNAYDSKYLRGSTPPSQRVKFQAYDVPYFSRFRLLLGLFDRLLSRRKPVDKLSTLPIKRVDIRPFS